MASYTVRCEGGASEAIEAVSLDEAREMAEDWLRDGMWDTSEGTVYVHGRLLWTDADGEEQDEAVDVTIQPTEPACSVGEHDWQSPHAIVGGLEENPGVWGHGGGVVIHEVCMRCGCERVTDTWAQDPSNGKQGLRSVSYERGKYAAEVQS